MDTSIPKEGRILGIDVGNVRTGVAKTDPLRIIVSPHGLVQEDSVEKAVAALHRLAVELEAVAIVAGLPLNQHGQPGPQAEKTLAFVERLREAVDIPVVTQDERYSTASAHRTLSQAKVKGRKRKKMVDSLAATVILQAYLDGINAQRKRGSSTE